MGRNRFCGISNGFPFAFDVLPAYVILLLATPFLAALTSRLIVYLCVIGGAYLAVQIGAAMDDDLSGRSGLFVNVFAWQFIFFLGVSRWRRQMASGALRLAFAGQIAPRVRAFLPLAVAVVFRADTLGFFHLSGVDKRIAACFWLAHAGLVVLALASAIVLLGPRCNSALFGIVGMIGRQTLLCYTASIVATYAIVAAWSSLKGGYVGILVAQMTIILIIFIAASVKEPNKAREFLAHMRPFTGVATGLKREAPVSVRNGLVMFHSAALTQVDE